jgi:epi-isozizaene 5-monooxygenase
LLGNGLATTNGAEHKRQRRMVQPAFRGERIAEYAAIMEEEARKAITSWKPGQRFEVRREMISFAMRIVSRSLFDTDSISEKTQRIERALQVLFSDMYTRMILPLPALHRLPTPGNLRFRRALSDFHRLVDEIIRERRLKSVTRRLDLLGLLLEARDEITGLPLSDPEIHDQLIAMVVAGVETVASSLCWTFHLLAQHPTEEARLHAEVDAVVGHAPVTFDALKRMPHLRNVITESLRLRPAVWMLTRRAVVDTKLGDYPIPAGIDLLYCPYSMQRDPRSFERPEAFEPDRWQPERAKQVPAFAMIPFSAGGRKCPGDHFSMTEAAIVLATMAARFRLVPTEKLDPRVQVGITLHPRWLEMEVQPRGA